jgi:hypothetical protein
MFVVVAVEIAVVGSASGGAVSTHSSIRVLGPRGSVGAERVVASKVHDFFTPAVRFLARGKAAWFCSGLGLGDLFRLGLLQWDLLNLLLRRGSLRRLPLGRTQSVTDVVHSPTRSVAGPPTAWK